MPVNAYSAAHQHSPLVKIRDAIDVIGTLDLRQRRTRFERIPVSGKHSWITSQMSKLLQAAAHLVGVAAGKIGAAAALHKQRVTGNQPAVEQEAVAARRVTGGVQQLDVDVAGADLVAMLML